MIKTIYKNLGIIDYKEAWDYQEELFAQKLQEKRNAQIPKNHLLICEHPPVFTLGKSGDDSNLLITQNLLDQKGIQYYFSWTGSNCRLPHTRFGTI